MVEIPQVVIRFWGVRGSIACPGADTARYGGNTSCVELRFGDRMVIFDAGTGLRLLGDAMLANGAPVDADIFFSHTHVDHVCGLPFFGRLSCRRAGSGSGPGTCCRSIRSRACSRR